MITLGIAPPPASVVKPGSAPGPWSQAAAALRKAAAPSVKQPIAVTPVAAQTRAPASASTPATNWRRPAALLAAAAIIGALIFLRR